MAIEGRLKVESFCDHETEMETERVHLTRALKWQSMRLIWAELGKKPSLLYLTVDGEVIGPVQDFTWVRKPDGKEDIAYDPISPKDFDKSVEENSVKTTLDVVRS